MAERQKEGTGIPAPVSPWLSVIVPIYNAERYLERCVRSILAQSFRDFEVLLMDDGSTDRTPEICRSFSERDARISYHPKENTGCYHNRLCGFHQAKGDYVTTIDADDYYLSDDVFEILYQKAQERECDLLQFGMKRVYRHLRRNGRVNDADSTVLAEEFHKKEYITLFGIADPGQHLFAAVHGKLYSRRLLKDLPPLSPVERLFNGEDVVINLYLLEHCASARFLPLRLYGYRETSGGTKRFSKTSMQDLDIVAAHKLEQLGKNPDLDTAAIEYRIYADIAGHLPVFTQNALLSLSKEETGTLLQQALRLPRFLAAKEYFIRHPEYDWPGVLLLCGDDPGAYVEEALRRNKKNALRRSAKDLLKKVYASI